MISFFTKFKANPGEVWIKLWSKRELSYPTISTSPGTILVTRAAIWLINHI